jgi:hypothetical protein
LPSAGLTDVADGDPLVVPIDADVDNMRRQPFIDDGAPKGGNRPILTALEDRAQFCLLIGTGCRIDVEPGLTAAFVEVVRPVGDQGKFRTGKVHAFGVSFLAVPSKHGRAPAFIRLDIRGQPTGAKGLAATNLEATSYYVPCHNFLPFR